jgi:hypothetical protein
MDLQRVLKELDEEIEILNDKLIDAYLMAECGDKEAEDSIEDLIGEILMIKRIMNDLQKDGIEGEMARFLYEKMVEGNFNKY